MLAYENHDVYDRCMPFIGLCGAIVITINSVTLLSNARTQHNGQTVLQVSREFGFSLEIGYRQKIRQKRHRRG